MTKFSNTRHGRKQIIADGVMTMVERICQLENGMESVEYFKPSKTAQNAINFISQKQVDELKLTNCDQIINIFKSFNILCGIEATDNIINNFFEHNKESLSINFF
jgi:hypothetical protein